MEGCAERLSWVDPTLVPCYVVASSILFLCVSAVGKPIGGRVDDPLQNGASGRRLITKLRQYAQERGGQVLLTFHALRLVCAAGLFSTASLQLWLDSGRVDDDAALGPSVECHPSVDLRELITYLYTTILCIAALLVPPRWTKYCTYHVGIVLLAQISVFAWRNLWPLMIFGGVPADIRFPILTWIQGAALTCAAVLIPLFVPEPYVPLDPKNPVDPPPERTASIASRNFFSFADSFLFRSFYAKDVPYDSLPVLADWERSAVLDERSRTILDPWERRKLGLKPRHLFFGLVHFFRRVIFAQVVLLIINVAAALLSPIAINRLLNYVETGGKDANVRPWVWIGLIFVARMVDSWSDNVYEYTTNEILIHGTNVLLQLVYQQCMRMRINVPTTREADSRSTPTASSSTSTPGSQNGKKQPLAPTINVNTLIGADIPGVVFCRKSVAFVVQLPLEILASVCFLTAILGWSAVIGMVFLVVTLPLPGLLVKRITEVRRQQMKTMDARVGTLTESLNILRMVKMFAWESMVKARIQEKRASEVSLLRTRRLVEMISANLSILLPVLSMIITYGSYALAFEYELDASIVFSSMSVFDLLRRDLNAITRDLNTNINVLISMNRVDNFLRQTPLLDIYEEDPIIRPENDRPSREEAIGFHDASFSWTPDEYSVNHRNFQLNIKGDLFFRRGVLNLIIGPTGCGKTSMVMAMLGEMRFKPLEHDGWFNLPRKHGIAFAVQESWVMNDTIRNNILFGAPYDEQRYTAVVMQCALEPDLQLLAAGDETEVGEKGITLSGGQKARVTLARAIYSKAEIVLLDDTLSALDVHTGRWIVDKCFDGHLVRERTIILVTHAVSLVGPIAQNITELDSNGNIKSHGPPARELVQSKVQEETYGDDTGECREVPDALNDKPDIQKVDGKLIVEEEKARGRLKWEAFELLLNGCGGIGFWMMLISLVLIARLGDIMTTWWLGVWTSSYETHSGTLTTAGYLAIFVALSLFQIGLTSVGNVIYIFRSMRACHWVHEVLVDSVMSSTLRWIDTTPRGRIISRFTLDIGEMDSNLTLWFIVFIRQTLEILLKFSAVILGAPLMLLPGLFVIAVGYGVGQVYLYVQMEVKRIRSNAESPIYNHFSAVIAGIVSIRAYGAQEMFKLELFDRLDGYSRPSRCFWSLHRWIAARVDMLGALFAAGVAVYLVYFQPPEAAGKTGFSLNMTTGFAGMILGWLRTANNMEVQANSLERIRDYINIPHEPKPTEAGEPPAYWPASGSLKVENLSARYSEGGPLVLRGITFDVKSGERVGIVGRTGSGKSTLALSLLRMIPTSGQVTFDNLPTSALNLEPLRRNITLIPQEPVLVSGTLRTNLDPWGLEDDSVLNSALEATGLLSRSGGRFALDTPVSDSGSNFSVGERQLIALARAIVRGTKLVILDEATASVDQETDGAIQGSVRREMGGRGVTLLTVAHRLRTVGDYDKIMVLDAGRLVEFDTPLALLEKEGGVFRGMVEGSGEKEVLWALARGAAGGK